MSHQSGGAETAAAPIAGHNLSFCGGIDVKVWTVRKKQAVASAGAGGGARQELLECRDIIVTLSDDLLTLYDQQKYENLARRRRDLISSFDSGATRPNSGALSAPVRLASYSLLGLSNVTNANTRRGVLIEIDNDVAHGRSTLLLPPETTTATAAVAGEADGGAANDQHLVVVVQFTCPDGSSRQTLYSALSNVWALAKHRRQISLLVAGAHRSSSRGASTIGDGGVGSPIAGTLRSYVGEQQQQEQQQQQQQRQQQHEGITDRRFSEVLTQVNALQQRTSELLDTIRSVDEAERDDERGMGDGEDDGDESDGQRGSFDNRQRGSAKERQWAFRQLQQRHNVVTVEAELQQIQERRARRQREQPGALGVRPQQQQQQHAAYDESTAGAAMTAQQRDPNVCAHCRKRMDSSNRATHQSKCAHRPITCGKCGRSMKARDYLQHTQSGCALTPRSSSRRGAGGGGGMERARSEVNLLASPRSRAGSVSSADSFVSLSPPRSARSNASAFSPRQSTPASPTSSILKRGGDDASGGGVGGANAASKWRKLRGAVAAGAAFQGTQRCPHCDKLAPEAHFTKCAHRPVQCHKCGVMLPIKDTAQHASTCTGKSKKGGAAAAAADDNPHPVRRVGSSRFQLRN